MIAHDSLLAAIYKENRQPMTTVKIIA